MKTKSIAAAVILPILFISATRAASTISASSSGPTTNLLDSFDNADVAGTSTRWRSSGEDDDNGSSFALPNTSPSFRIDAVTFKIGSGIESGANGLPIVFQMFGYNGNAASPVFTSLFETTATLPNPLVEGSYLTLDLAGDTSLTALQRTLAGDAQYAFLVGSNVEDTAASSTNRFRLVATSDSGALDSTVIQVRRTAEFGSTRPGVADTSDLSVLASQDTVFFVQGVAIPEPSAALLGAMGALFLLRRKR